MSPQTESKSKNKFFDAQVKSEVKVTKVRIMCNFSTKRSLFVGKFESKTPVRLSGLSPPVTNGMVFYNSNSGSRITEMQDIAFKFDELEIAKY